MYDPSGRWAPGTALRRSDAAGVAARSAFLGELQATATASASISTERVLTGSPSASSCGRGRQILLREN